MFIKNLLSNNFGKPKHVAYLYIYIYIFTTVYVFGILLHYTFVHGHCGLRNPRGNSTSFEYRMTINMNFA